MIHLNLIEKRITTFKENSLPYDPRGRNKPIQRACEQQGQGLSISVVVEKDKDGYFAFSPELQGYYSQGDTYEDALENIKDAIRLHVEDRLESGEDVPQPESISLTSPEVAV